MCGEPRGTDRKGRVSSCICQGIECRRCGHRRHRPISAQYDHRSRRWWGTPWLAGITHGCPPGTPPGPRGWIKLEADPDLEAEQDRLTAMVWREVGARAAARSEIEANDRIGRASPRELWRRAGLLFVRAWDRRSR
jgi:hypothetical protein